MLAPVRWLISKIVESHIRWKLRLKKYGMVPEHSFFKDVTSSLIAVVPEAFYNKVEEGNIILKKSKTFGFCKRGLILDGEAAPIETDVVILATGFKGNASIQEFHSLELLGILRVWPTCTLPRCGAGG